MLQLLSAYLAHVQFQFHLSVVGWLEWKRIYSCVSLFTYASNLTQYPIYCFSCNMKFTIIDMHGCSIVLALLVNEALTIAASLTVPGFVLAVHKCGVRGVQCVEVIQRFVCYFPSPSACTQCQHTHTHTIRAHNTQNTHNTHTHTHTHTRTHIHTHTHTHTYTHTHIYTHTHTHTVFVQNGSWNSGPGVVCFKILSPWLFFQHHLPLPRTGKFCYCTHWIEL